ncbi:MAG: TonB family protein [Acidobacteria bacterium]|nr:TonB family protein [Acidobacteriota bacterium]
MNRPPDEIKDWESSLLLDLQEERITNRRRETFLASVILHLVLVLVIVTQPDLFRGRDQELAAMPVRPRDVTMLYQPPDLPKLKTAPKTDTLSDANRKAQRGSERPLNYRPPTPPPSPAPSQAPPAPPSNAPRPDETRIARDAPPPGVPDARERAKEVPKPRPTLEPVPRAEPSPSQAQLNLPAITPPSRGTDSILRGLAKDHATGGGQTFGGAYPDLGPQDPNLNIPGPQILSDTMGVDFNPYLMRVLSVVRRNWYTVIPEIARLGRQGRVVLQFSILRNGGVPDLVLTSSSGTESMDAAALSSIRLSNPFPPLPPEFPGQDIRLRFIYLYNMRVEY